MYKVNDLVIAKNSDKNKTEGKVYKIIDVDSIAGETIISFYDDEGNRRYTAKPDSFKLYSRSDR